MCYRSLARVLLVGLLLTSLPIAEGSDRPVRKGKLTGNKVISSAVLGYKLQYRVYMPAGYKSLSDLPVIYVTDGQWYIEMGEMPAVIDRLIAGDEIEPLIAVFVDNRDPENLSDNRRNRQFFCNEAYAEFFTRELVPAIDAAFRTKAARQARTILGLSFGGLNSACFALQAGQTFEGIAMQSPALHPVPGIYEAHRDQGRLPLRVFLSSGTVRDNLESTRRLKRIVEERGHALRYIEVDEGHDWRNWGPLIDDLLLYFYGPPG